MEYKSKIQVMKCVLVRDNELDYIGDVRNSTDISELAYKLGYNEFAEEVLGMFVLNAHGTVTGYHEISRGDLTSAIATPREVLKRAILDNAANIVLIHNHLSGCVTPSNDDIELTKRIKEACKLMKVGFTDHIILATGVKDNEHDYSSFVALGLI